MAQNSQQSSLSSDSSSSSISVSNAPIAERRARNTYPCTHCDKTFPTAMALGGHQNAHRRERALGKRPAETFLSNQRHPTFGASFSSSMPLTYGPTFNAGYPSRIARELMETNKPSYVVQEAPPSVDHVRYFQELYDKEMEKWRAMRSPLPGVNHVPPPGSSTIFGGQEFFGASSASKTAPSIGASGTANSVPFPPLIHSVPPPAATNTTFFGVRDFFAASSAAVETAPSVGASGIGNVLDSEDEEEEKEEIDLDLKL